MPPRWRVKNFLSNFKHTPATLKHVPMRISEVVITATFNISYRYVTALFFLTKKKQKQKKLRWRLICTSRRQGRHWGKTRKQKPRTYLQSSAIDYSYSYVCHVVLHISNSACALVRMVLYHQNCCRDDTYPLTQKHLVHFPQVFFLKPRATVC